LKYTRKGLIHYGALKNNFWEPPLLEIDATDPPVKSTSEASFDAK
jgi:hypothetical protein